MLRYLGITFRGLAVCSSLNDARFSLLSLVLALHLI